PKQRNDATACRAPRPPLPPSAPRSTWRETALADGSVFTFAGLGECWQPPDGGDPVETCTIVTTEANDLVRPLHDRMPVTLEGSDRDAWLKADAEPAQLQSLLRPFPPGLMEAYAVSTLVNNPRNDRRENLDRLAV